MDSAELLAAMRARIVQTQQQHAARRSRESGYPPMEEIPSTILKIAELPDLPPMLPRPSYAMESDLIGQSDTEVSFYVACEMGLISEVTEFLQSRHNDQAVLQFGLEQASFGNQPEVARYLLQRGTVIHNNSFIRCEKGEDVTIFDGEREDPLALVQVYLDFGWHPNQLWSKTGASYNSPKQPLVESLHNKPLLTLLLSHGAEPGLSRHNIDLRGDIRPLDRHSGSVLDSAVRLWDPSLVELLLKHGANPSYSKPLHSVVQWVGLDSWRGHPFPARRAMAEYLVSSSISKVDEVKCIYFSDIVAQPRPRKEDMTPFILACAAQDWAMAIWLLQNGADADALGGKAFQPLYYRMPDRGPSCPSVVRSLVSKVKGTI